MAQDRYEKRKQCSNKELFKENMNRVFLDLVLENIKNENANIIYLDAESGETSKKFIDLHYKCFVANPNDIVVESLQKYSHVNVVKGDITTLLSTNWKHVSFQAAYFDSCHSYPEAIISMFEAFFQRQMNTQIPIVIGYTIVGRALDKRSQLSRKEDVEHALVKHAIRLNMKLSLVSGMKNYVHYNWLDNGIYTKFFLFEPIVDLTPLIDLEQKIEDVLNKKLQFVKPKTTCAKKVTFDMIPIMQRLDGQCCMVGCNEKPTHPKGRVCETHYADKLRMDCRAREKRRPKKLRKISYVTSSLPKTNFHTSSFLDQWLKS